ncbi:MAG TPA: hypothetical protein PLA71_00200 [Saccharofermentans sp.]|nr:hypothetical protein [Saccharofermentans sp.]
MDYDKKLTAIGDVVVLKKLERSHTDDLVGGVAIPIGYAEGHFGMTAGIIESITKDTSEKYGIKEGDVVLYDSFSVFYNVHPIVVTKVENIIFKTKSN